MVLFGKRIFFKNRPPSAVSQKSDERDLSRYRKNPHIFKIVVSFKDRSRKDIQKWRQALMAIQNNERPRYNFYHDLIEDLQTDGHLQSQVQLRKLSTLNTDYRIIDRLSGKENEDLMFIFQQQWFFQFIEHCLDSIIYGATVIEFTAFFEEKIYLNLIPRRNAIPNKGYIIPDLSSDTTINYRDTRFAPWVLQLGNDEDLGIINNIVPNLIWKRNVAQSWAEFCERFGLPLITATTNTADSKIIDNVHEMLLQLGEASVGTFPPGTEINFQEANRTDAFNVYKQFLQTNADEISKQLVGSTMLSDQGTNRSQTEVHERSLDGKIAQADKRMIQFMINDQLLPLLKMHGYNIGDNDFFEFKTAEQEIELDKVWMIVNGLLMNGYNVEQEWISKTFNIPLDGKRTLPMFGYGYSGNPVPEDKGPSLPVALHHAAKKKRYEGLSCNCGNHIQAISGPSQKEIDDFTEKLIEYIFEGKDTLGIEAGLIATEANVLLKGLRSNFKTYNQFVGPDHLMLQMMEYNLFEFATGKTEARMAAMTELLFDEKKELRDFASFRMACDREMKPYNKNWLETEYNLSIAVGQNSAQYARFMAEKDSITSYVQYQTAGDDRVRASHEALDGRVFSLNDKEAMEIWPPNGYGCRCEMLQFLGNPEKKLTPGQNAKRMIYQSDPKYKGSQFEINRGDLKQVFTKKQFYADAKKMTAKINDMTFEKYTGLDGKPLLKSWDDFKDTLKNIILDNTITADNVAELFKKVKGTDYMGFTDYLGRKLTMSEETFKNHTAGHYIGKNEMRHQLFPHLKKALKNPDEVWLYDYKQNKRPRYIKYYKDMVLVIDCSIDDRQGLKIQSWYQMKDKENKIRKGLKIK